MVDRELSIGDYVLTGGELAALVVVDAVLRLLPGRDRRGVDRRGVVRRRACSSTRSTRARRRSTACPCPPVLVSGHHEEVRRWRLRESLRRTLERRPDLLDGRALSPEEAGCWTSCATSPTLASSAERLLDEPPTPDTRHRAVLSSAVGRAVPRHAVHRPAPSAAAAAARTNKDPYP